VALHEGLVRQRFMAAPLLVALAAPAEEFTQPVQRRQRPHQMASGQRQQAGPVAPQVEARGVAQRQCEDELRAHAVEHRRLAQAGRQHSLDFGASSHSANLQRP